MDALKTHEGIQDFLSYTSIGYRNPMDAHQDIYREIWGMNIVNRIKEQFPKEMIFFTTGELGIIAFNRLEGARKMMLKRPGRFFDSSNDLQKLLPDGVNVNDRHEVERFLIESADVFSEIFLAVEP